jgi:SAM-dependent methyltransferase
MSSPLNLDAHQQNRRSWNAVTGAHNSHKPDQPGFFRAGGSTLFPDEIELAGELRGQSLLHLQCNCGQDTLSFAQLGANVTGVDISDEAIAFAQNLSRDSGIPGRFIRSDLLEWFPQASADGERFDVVFTSYGTVIWLSDLAPWGRGIASVLKPGGRFVFLDFHPTMLLLGEDWTPVYPIMDGAPEMVEEGIGDYVAWMGEALTPGGYEEGVKDFKNPHEVVEFGWSVGNIVTALIEAGLTISTLREYPYSNGFAPHSGYHSIGDGRFAMPEGRPAIPMMLGIVATK